MNRLNWPLMDNNITDEDLAVLIDFLKGSPRLTQGEQVRVFEEEWSQWLGVRHSVFVNSGSSANLITMAALRHLHGPGEVIVPTLTWVSDISSVLLSGLTPIFVDIDPRTLCMDERRVLDSLNPRTRAVFITHAQGFNGLTDTLLATLAQRNIPLIEDVCEAHGATHGGRRLGSFGQASNFSFYFAHHMSTIEGGMVCTSDPDLFNVVRMLRSHGMVREAPDEVLRNRFADENPALNPDFIFAHAGFNVRGTELNAVLGRSQLKRLDAAIPKRNQNFIRFLEGLDARRYFTDFQLEGISNYALNLILAEPDLGLRDRVERMLREAAVEFRRGSAGGGNQLRQPYLRGIVPHGCWEAFPHVEHVHHFGWYIGNYPDLPSEKIDALCRMLNAL